MHVTKKLSGFINHELPSDERQTVGEHLLSCADCRAEHEQIKLGASLARELKQWDAPENLWQKIENALDEKKEKALPAFAFFNLRPVAATAGLLIVGVLAATTYFGFLRGDEHEIVQNKPSAVTQAPPSLSKPSENLASQNSNETVSANDNSNAQIAAAQTPPQPTVKNSRVEIAPKNASIQPKRSFPPRTKLPSWTIETIAGQPRIGNARAGEKLAVGEFLETDADSRARVQVADIGSVEIAPNSRVRLVKTTAKEHRLALDQGSLHAKIIAPPRLFIVDTPSAVAVDLGCEYTLEVDAEGNSNLKVTSGFVALERDGLESIVPAGASCLTKKGKGLGTPFSDEASAALKRALLAFDFQNGGEQALQEIIKESNTYDALTLWHLLPRTPSQTRAKVFDALDRLVKLPPDATREGILRLDKKMLEAWWAEIENVWFG